MIYLIGYSISLVFLVISLFIFCYFRQLHCTRITIHKHLFVSFIIHNLVWIIHDNVIPSSPEVLKENAVRKPESPFHTTVRVTSNMFVEQIFVILKSISYAIRRPGRETSLNFYLLLRDLNYSEIALCGV